MVMRLHIKPGARQSRITDVSEQGIGMQVAAPPREGEANEEVINFLSEQLAVKPRNLSLVAGHRSRDKVLVLEAGLFASEDGLLEKLMANIKK